MDGRLLVSAVLALIAVLLFVVLPRLPRLRRARHSRSSGEGTRRDDAEGLAFPRALQRSAAAPASGRPAEYVRRTLEDRSGAGDPGPHPPAEATASGPQSPPRGGGLARIESLPRYRRAVVWAEILRRPDEPRDTI